MNIHIEGPNGSGKSTLADVVKNALRWDQMNLHHREGDQFLRYIAEYGRKDTVFVRSHWSEFVYSHLFGRPKPFTPEEFACLSQAARLRGIVVICLPRSVDTLVQRFEERQRTGTDQDKQAKLELIEQEYRLWATTLYPEPRPYKHCSDNYAQNADYCYRGESKEDLLQAVQDIVRIVRALGARMP